MPKLDRKNKKEKKKVKDVKCYPAEASERHDDE